VVEKWVPKLKVGHLPLPGQIPPDSCPRTHGLVTKPGQVSGWGTCPGRGECPETGSLNPILVINGTPPPGTDADLLSGADVGLFKADLLWRLNWRHSAVVD